MKIIICREMKNYIKNPIYWIGLVVVVVSIWMCLKPYLGVGLFVTDSEIKNLKEANSRDADVMEGYIPVSEEKQLDIGLIKVKESFLQYYDMNEEGADKAIADIKSQRLSIDETVLYLQDKYEYYDGKAVFMEAEYQKGNKEEINKYIEEKLNNHTYTYYFAKKFADFTGLHLAFYACVLLAFLFVRDMKKDTYELLHTKAITAKTYVCGKFFGGLAAMLLVLLIVTAVFSAIGVWHSLKEGFDVNIFELFYAAFIYVVPTIVTVVGIYTMIALLFRNPLPALPLILGYIIYSNMGGYNGQGNYGFNGKIMGILFRFDGRFFENSIPAIYSFNQIALPLITVLFVLVAIRSWKRRTI